MDTIDRYRAGGALRPRMKVMENCVWVYVLTVTHSPMHLVSRLAGNTLVRSNRVLTLSIRTSRRVQALVNIYRGRWRGQRLQNKRSVTYVCVCVFVPSHTGCLRDLVLKPGRHSHLYELGRFRQCPPIPQISGVRHSFISETRTTQLRGVQ